MEKQQPLTIVLVEDDPGHALLIEKNLRRAGVVNPIVPLSNGREALDYLAGRLAGGNGPDAPSILMLLDLNMPVLDGYEVLKAVKSDERSRCMPVVILTTTDSPPEVERCYKLGCNAYIAKPIGFDQFSDTMRKLGMFLSIVKLPVIEEQYG
jgi:CheY-like chemotaxis protein